MAGSGSLDVPSEAGPGSAAQAARGAEPRWTCTHDGCGYYGFAFCPWCGVSTKSSEGAVPPSSEGILNPGGQGSRLEPAGAVGIPAGPGSSHVACHGNGCLRLCELCAWGADFPTCEDGRKGLLQHLELAHPSILAFVRELVSRSRE
jgi:hypothetical protein